MPLNFSTDPYFDDFNENNGFYKILFRPGYSVQTRELNQLQSILQNQISKVGDHLFKHGSVVIPGAYDIAIGGYIELDATLSNITNLSELIGRTIYCGSSDGSMLYVYGATEKTNLTPHTLFVKTVKLSNEATPKQRGNINDTVYIQDYDSAHNPLALVACGSIIKTDSGNQKTLAWTASIDEGVYYVNGYFVKVLPHSLGLAKIADQSTDTTNLKVGLNITESVVTDSSDSSLLDPALGTSNELAPGAHRYKISLTLAAYGINDTTSVNFIELTRIVNGVQSVVHQEPQYNELMKIFARRTYETNGNYALSPFSFKVQPWLRVGTNNGIYSQTETLKQFVTTSPTEETAALDYAKSVFGVEISENKAYVNGFESYVGKNTFVKVNRARNKQYIKNGVSLFNSGNYFYVGNVVSMPMVDTGVIIELRDAPIKTPGTPAGNIIGYAKVRNILFHSGTSAAAADAVFKLFVYDILMDSGKTEFDIGSFNLPTSGASPCNGHVLQMYYIVNNTKDFVPNLDITGSDLQSGVKSFRWDSANKRLWAIKEGPVGSVQATGGAYTGTGTVIFTFTDGGGTGATATMVITTGTAGAFTVTTGGDGYVYPPSAFTTGVTGTAAVVTPPTVTSTVTWESVLREGDTITQASPLSYGTVSNRIILNKNEKASQLVTLPNTWIGEVKDSLGNSNTKYTIQRPVSIVLNGSGIGTYTAATNETLSPISNETYSAYCSTGASKGVIQDASKLGLDGTLKILTFTDAALASQTIIAYVPIVKTVSSVGAKTDTMTNLAIAVPAEIMSLGVVDAYELVSVYDSEALGTPATNAHTDIVKNYQLVPNQNTAGYAESFIRVLPGKRAARGQILVVFKHFVQGTGDIYTVDSYTSLGTEYRALIPHVSDGATSIFLRDAIDSRNASLIGMGMYSATYTTGSPIVTLTSGNTLLIPVGSNVLGEGIAFGTTVLSKNANGLAFTLSANPTIVAASASAIVVGVDLTSTFATTAVAKSNLQNNTTMTYDYSYYMPRIDSLYLVDDSTLKLIEGAPATEPSPAEQLDPRANMLIAYIGVPPYTPDSELLSIALIPQEHRRYTMEDITKLDSRLGIVEEMVSQNQLNQSVKDTQIVDSNTGLNRYKSGFATDSFTTVDFSDIGSLEYRASLDLEAGELRPRYRHFPVQMQIDTTGALVLWGDVYVIPYTEEVAINQDTASRPVNVNGNSSFSWYGSATVTPNVDYWTDTQTLPLKTIRIN